MWLESWSSGTWVGKLDMIHFHSICRTVARVHSGLRTLQRLKIQTAKLNSDHWASAEEEIPNRHPSVIWIK
ncbi:hypothetical protein HBH56_140670 [Parastagonospora nodorum]|nr:hypothetical protein HBH56_140670 [Parastagonospora nodorum]KAH3928228.1 hypothetical protein HBH54_145810 [Parastagonospora nodorum]KAH3948952.1 hypothetical protein HBH53_095810 [Parastagonospora nodorum]KAH4061323.1 hypothetical protein HBH49_013780 [Parastagonospora nodorum]KAH4166260.1 hypothetical protein HBH43_138790 [Parastagonospora nodorum]